MQHLLHELGRMDQLLRQAVRRLRAAQPDGPLEFRGLYVPEENTEVDAMLSGAYPIAPGFRSPQNGGEDGPTVAVRERGIELRLLTLADRAGLTDLDVDLLLVCLAPELDLRYERLYAYLQDDVTRKRPTVDLALNLLCPSTEAKLSARPAARAERPADPPRHPAALSTTRRSPQPPLLSRYLKAGRAGGGATWSGPTSFDPRLAPYAAAHPAQGQGWTSCCCRPTSKAA